MFDSYVAAAQTRPTNNYTYSSKHVTHQLSVASSFKLAPVKPDTGISRGIGYVGQEWRLGDQRCVPI